MVSSTDIPKAILKIKMVEGFIGIPKNPIRPAVVINGRRFGNKETSTILTEENKIDINDAISIIAKMRLVIKFSIR